MDVRVLVLGHKGMLGNAIVKYLKQYYIIDTIDHRFPSFEFENYIKQYNGDFIVNCIGTIPQKTTEFDINYKLPIFLTNNTKSKIIHPSTDCENDDTPYGISKLKATEWLLNNFQNIRIIKTSIIGIENNSSYSLLGWTLSQTGEINGYTEAKWNGITTLEWAKKCHNIVKNWNLHDTLTTFTSNCISKFELLNIIKSVYNLNITINPVNLGKNKCLEGIFTSDIKTQLVELKEFYAK